MLKNGQTIFLKGTDAKFIKSYKEKSNVIVYHLYDTTVVSENEKKIAVSENIIEFNEISSAKVKITNENTGLTILIALNPLILAALFFLAVLISFSFGGFRVG